jgi:hypothetical protein
VASRRVTPQAARALPATDAAEVNQLERSLDAEPMVNPQLRAFIQRMGVNREARLHD